MILLIIGIKYLIDYASTVDNLYWIMGIYLFICFLTYQLNRKFKNKIFDFISLVVLFPLSLLYAFIKVAIPILSTQIYLFVYLGFSFIIPVIFYRIDENLLLTELKDETWIYIIITTGVITATLFHKQITFLTFKSIPFNFRKSEKMKRFIPIELCEYIVSKNNIKLVIYALFFVAIIVFTFLDLQQNSYYENPNIDKSILQSFVTFIAFERILTNSKLTEFRPSQLLKTLKSYIFNETEMGTDKKTTGNNVYKQ